MGSFGNSCGKSENSYLYVVQPGDTLSKILMRLHGPTISACQAQLLELLAVVLHNNPQITNPNSIVPGQCVDVSLFRRPIMDVNRWKFESVAAARSWAKLEPDKQKLAEQQADLLGLLLKVSGAGLGMAAAHQDAMSKQLSYISQLIKTHNETVGALVHSRMAGNSKTMGQQLAQQLNIVKSEQALKSALNELSYGMKSSILETSAGAPSLMGSNINRVQKNLIRVSKMFSEDANIFAPYLERVGKLGIKAGRLAAGGTYVLPFVIGGIQVANDWNTPKRGRTAAKAGASIAGGFIGGAAGYYLCTLIFFGPTGGTSPLWCGLVASGGGGILASEMLEGMVDKLFEAKLDAKVIVESEKCRIPGR